MPLLLGFSRIVDWVNERLADMCNVLVLLACLVSAVNAMIRYAYDTSSNAWLEAQWYMFAAIVMLGAAYTFRKNEHVRVDIVYMMLNERQRLWLDLAGTLVFMIPSCILIGWLSWPFFRDSFAILEESHNAGGLWRWPVKFLMPLGFALLTLQGLSEVIKRIAALQGMVLVDGRYERPLQ